MSPAAINIFNLCVTLLLLNSGSWAEQCRLIAHGISDPSIPSGIPPPINSSTSPSKTNTSKSNQPFAYGQDVVRGVNLGGWFVLEPWITPSIFQNTNNSAIVDEYTLGQMLDPAVALNILENHWSTWITENDFVAINAAGLTHVRIPVGYWSVPLTSSDTNFSTSVAPYIQGAWPYLLKALGWANAHSLHVVVDLHGAPGSQNGYDNSGQRTSNPTWAQNSSDVALTLDVLRFIAKELDGMIDILELLNEPAGFLGDSYVGVLRQFFQNGYNEVRATTGSSLSVMIADSFIGLSGWDGFLTYPGSQGVFMDYHQYQIFSDPELSRSFDEHIKFTCSLIPGLISFASSNIWTIMGEWSTAPTDCAMWLNGRGIGARWDGSIDPGQGDQVFGSCTGWTGSFNRFSSNYTTFLRQYWEAQISLGESVQGWIYWTWKAENADEWSYSKGLEGGWIPQDPTNRLYPNICSSKG